MILDHNRVRDITQGNDKLIVSVSQLLLSELPDMISDIDYAYEQNDRQRLVNAIHRLKSALGNFVTSDYYEEVSYLETSAAGNTSPVTPFSDWITKWKATKFKLDTMIIELTAMAGK